MGAQNQGVVLELVIPPTKRPGSVVVTHPASHGEVLGSNPGLVILFSLTIPNEAAAHVTKMLHLKFRVNYVLVIIIIHIF